MCIKVNYSSLPIFYIFALIILIYTQTDEWHHIEDIYVLFASK